MGKRYYIKGKGPHKQTQKSIEDLSKKSFEELYSTLKRLYDQEKYDEMFPYCMKCMELNPLERSLDYYMGLALGLQGKYTKAAEHLDKFLRYDEHNRDALINASHINQHVNTLESYSKSLKLHLLAEREKDPKFNIDDLINQIEDINVAKSLAEVFDSRLPE
jgi:tetratricopeptide (TPR) repeat protein|tara:strand:- start:30 stop:515 length:486 start_codon:yes stop_codon:yes gene_type:complete